MTLFLLTTSPRIITLSTTADSITITRIKYLAVLGNLRIRIYPFTQRPRVSDVYVTSNYISVHYFHYRYASRGAHWFAASHHCACQMSSCSRIGHANTVSWPPADDEGGTSFIACANLFNVVQVRTSTEFRIELRRILDHASPLDSQGICEVQPKSSMESLTDAIAADTQKANTE